MTRPLDLNEVWNHLDEVFRYYLERIKATTMWNEKEDIYNEYVKIYWEDGCMWIPECVGCGYCCIKAPCAESMSLFQSKQCPVLHWNNDSKRYECLLVKDPSFKGDFYRKELAIGEGCCSSLNSWRKNVKKREEVHG